LPTLAKKISAEFNFDYVKNIKTDGLLEWASTAGFTVDELKLIQPTYGWDPYPYPILPFPIDSGIVIINPPEPFTTMCNNGIDDDLDGLIDLNDSTECACTMQSGAYTPISISGSACNGDTLTLSMQYVVIWSGYYCWSVYPAYQWYYEGIAIPGATSPSISIPGDTYGPGEYSIAYNSYSAYCSAICNAYTVNVGCISTGIADQSSEATEDLNIEIKGRQILVNRSGDISIYNLTGQLIHQTVHNGKYISLDKQGIYIVRVRTEDKMLSKKIYIE